MSENVYWLLEVAIKPGEFDNFKALMEEMVEATQANEPNTLNYEWTISEDSQTMNGQSAKIVKIVISMSDMRIQQRQ
jgi:quinol monooxygenase YgiN